MVCWENVEDEKSVVRNSVMRSLVFIMNNVAAAVVVVVVVLDGGRNREVAKEFIGGKCQMSLFKTIYLII